MQETNSAPCIPSGSGADQAATLAFAVSQSSAVFYVADPAREAPLRFISANIEAITGHRPAAFLEDADYGARHIHPDDLPRYQSNIRKLETSGSLLHEYRFATAEGNYRWFRDEVSLVDGPHGGRQLVGCMIDVTAEKEAQFRLREAEETLEDAIEALPEGFALFDREDRLVMCNSRFREFNSVSADALVSGVGWLEFNRTGAERGQYPEAVEDIDDWLEGIASERGVATNREFQQSDGRWFEYSHRTTRHGGLVVTRREITERKEMEQSLRESDELVRWVLETCPVPVRMSNPATSEVIYESPACRALFGRDATKLPREQRLTHYVDASDRERYLSLLQAEGSANNVEMQLRRADGTTFWAAVSARLIDYKGQQAIVSSTVDLTERKERETELRQARETLEDAIKSVPEGFALFDADDKLVLCNAKFREFNDLSADVLVPGVTWQEFIRIGAERGQYMDALGRKAEWVEERCRYHSLGTGKPGGVEFQQHDGRWFHAFSQSTRQGGYVGIRIDITEQKKLEESLRESEALVRQVLEACPVPVTLNRAEDGVIIYESPAAQTLLGYGESQVGQSVISRWVDLADRQAYLRLLRRKTAIDGFEIRYKRASGEGFPCAISSRLIDYRGEEVIVSNIFDLTERKEAEKELARQRDLLHQSEKLSALGELLAGISHELNNPLSVLVGQATMLQKTTDDPATLARADKIGKAADRCGRIVKSFLAMARQESHDIVPVDLNASIEEALEVTAYSLRTAGIDLGLRMAEDLPPVMADPDQIRQVFTNLIVNAQHALEDVEGPRRLRIESSYRRTKDQVAVKFKDNGPGVPAEHRSRIFEPLYTTKSRDTGTGMGLALCHRIVEACGGTIELESEAGEGAAFAIRLPCARGAQDALETAARGKGGATSFRILVVDDEPDVGEIICDVLEHEGHSVELVRSGEAALQKIARRTYDAVLSDVRMPGMDGITFYQVLSDVKPEQLEGLAFITGDSLSARVRSFLDASQRPYLEKPIRPQDIRELVNQLVRRKGG